MRGKTRKIKMLSFHILCFIIFVIFHISYLNSAFKDLNWGVRPSGIGGAFVAISDDVNAIMYNPAGVDQVLEKQAQFMYSLPYAGLKLYSGEEDKVLLGQSYFAVVLPTKIGSFGLSWADFFVTSLYSEDIYTLTYSKRINDFSEKLWGIIPIYCGINLKYLVQQYIIDERTKIIESQSKISPFNRGTQNNAFTIDLGVLLCILNFKFGLCIKNLTQPEIGLVQKDIIPIELRMGAAYQTTYKIFDVIIPTIEFYYRKPQNVEQDFRYIIGVEGNIGDKYIIRTGINDREFTLGGGLNLLLSSVHNRRVYLTLDYAFMWSFVITDNFGSHKISVGLKF